VADTESGKVVGYIRNDIRIFKGIPYAEIHSPEGCWMRGARTKPWTGRRSSRAAGLVCPQGRAPEPDGLLDEVVFRGTGSLPTHPGEDCHGGGFTGVSSLAAIHYEFANLAEHGDVVVVSINHRLSCFGFLGLTGFGERFAESAGLGMLDVVDALGLEM